MIQIGVTTEMNIILYKGQDYRISICSDQSILGDPSFRLVELRREQVEESVAAVDSVSLTNEDGEVSGSVRETRITSSAPRYETVRKVLYDSTEDEMSQSIEFSATATKRIVLELIAPGSENTKRLKDQNAPDIGCVGVLVEHMPTPGLGF